MPGILLPTTMEFLMVVADGVAMDPATAGGFRIIDDGKAPPRLEVKVCKDRADGEPHAWRAPRKGDLTFLHRVLAAHPDEFFDSKAAFASLQSAINTRLAAARIEHAALVLTVPIAERVRLVAGHIDALQALANFADDLAGGK